MSYLFNSPLNIQTLSAKSAPPKALLAAVTPGEISIVIGQLVWSFRSMHIAIDERKIKVRNINQLTAYMFTVTPIQNGE